MICIYNLHKYYGDNHLFKGINLTVTKGDVVVLIGPSGSGKSTLLRCINGLENFQDGKIFVAGMELHSLNREKPSRDDFDAIRHIRLKIGMVFQQFNLFPHMTVLENIIEAPTTVLNVQKSEAVELQ
jgi:ABC-type polar amino acid transport system ATPase subunit